MTFYDEDFQDWFDDRSFTEVGFQIRAYQYGVKEARRMQDEDEYLADIACELITTDPEDQRHKSMKTRTFLFYSDPGHAWVKVPKAFLRTIIGHDWRKVFTPFSYERGDFTYLEEDEDAGRFVNWCKVSGIKPIIKRASTGDKRSRIRSYSPLQPIEDKRHD